MLLTTSHNNPEKETSADDFRTCLDNLVSKYLYEIRNNKYTKNILMCNDFFDEFRLGGKRLCKNQLPVCWKY